MTIRAESSNTNGNVHDIDVLPNTTTPAPLTYAVGVAYATKQTTAAGDKYEARSKVTAQATKVAAAEIAWTSLAADFGINVLAPTGTTGETAQASWVVFDPWFFEPNGSPFTIDLSFTPAEGWSFLFPTFAANEAGAARTRGSAATNVPGLENLFSWEVLLKSGSLQPVVSFQSDPDLGLNDASISSQIAQRYTFDSTTNTWSFSTSNFALAASFEIDGSRSLALTTTMGSDLTMSVPEPATLTLIGLGMFAVACSRRLQGHARRRANAAHEPPE